MSSQKSLIYRCQIGQAASSWVSAIGGETIYLRGSWTIQGASPLQAIDRGNLAINQTDWSDQNQWPKVPEPQPNHASEGADGLIDGEPNQHVQSLIQCLILKRSGLARREERDNLSQGKKAVENVAVESVEFVAVPWAHQLDDNRTVVYGKFRNSSRSDETLSNF